VKVELKIYARPSGIFLNFPLLIFSMTFWPANSGKFQKIPETS